MAATSRAPDPDLAVVISPSAERGRSRSSTRAALETFRAAGRTPSVLGGDLAAIGSRLADLVAAGADRVVAIGGDGTVHQLLQAVAGSSTVLGVVPVGTGNDFSHALGLSTDPVVAANAALGSASSLDAIRITSGARTPTWVASVATAGFSAVVNERANRLSRPRGAARYSVATMLALPGLRPLELRVGFDDADPVEIETVLFAVANTAFFGGGMQICPAADAADGELDVTVVGPVGRLALLRTFPRIFSGTHLRHPAVHTHRAKTLQVAGPAEGAGVWGDGEPVAPFPVTFEAVPGAVFVAGCPRRPAD